MAVDNVLRAPLYTSGESFLNMRHKKFPVDPDILDQIHEVPDSQKPGYSPVLRNILAKDKLISAIHPEISTVFDCFNYNRVRTPDAASLFYRDSGNEEYKSFSYGDCFNSAMYIGSALRHVCPGEPIVTLYMPNRYQFVWVELGCMTQSLPTTCLYDSLGADSFGYIFSLTKSPVVFTDKSMVSVLLQAKIQCIKVVITNGPLSISDDFEIFQAAKNQNILLIDLESFMEIGRVNLYPLRLPNPDTIHTISFTSGTTSLPKGVILTHRSLASSVVSMILCSAEEKEDPKGFMLLPLAHCYGRISMYFHLLLGHKLHFPHDPKNVFSYFKDIKVIKPSALLLVPRVITKIETAIRNITDNSPLIRKKINGKIQTLRDGKIPSTPIFDFIIGRKIKAALGFENLTHIATGSAPLAKETALFLKAVLNVKFISGYGLTECNAIGFVGSASISHLGTDGVLSTGLEFKLKDVPAMGYSWEGNKSGELLMRGPSMCSGYFKAEQKYKETCEDDWFCTGDVVSLGDHGAFHVVDRIKNFFKLANGKFVASDKVQNVYMGKNSFLEQVFAYGDGYQSFLVGVIGVNIQGMGHVLLKLGIEFVYSGKRLLENDYIHYNEVCLSRNPDMEFINAFVDLMNVLENKKKILNAMNAKVQGHLVGYEMFKNVYLTYNPFTVSDGTIGPTLKLKRQAAKEKFQDIIDNLYKEGFIVESSAKL